MTDFRRLRIGYVPYDETLQQPGDRRRFCFWAAHRGVHFEIADPSSRYDLVYLTTRADITRWRRYEGTARVVYELIDSYLALPPLAPKNLLRGAAKFITGEIDRPVLSYTRALENVCRRAEAVVCSTQEQADTIRRHNSNVHIILDAHDEVSGPTKTRFEIGERLRLVWEGLPQNLHNFQIAAAPLRLVGAKIPTEMHLVTDPTFKRFMGRYVQEETAQVAERYFDNFFIHPWSAQGLAEQAVKSDLALIPLNLHDPLAAGKPENKLLIFWRLGIPTLTSATPAYARTMRAAGIDMTCSSEEEWFSKVETYAGDRALREAAAKTALDYVTTHHSIEGLLQRWDRLFETVLDGP